LEELKKSVKPKATKPVKPNPLTNNLAAKPKAAPGLKKVPKTVKTPAKITEVLKVSEPKPAASTEKVKKAAAPVKKGATVKNEACQGYKETGGYCKEGGRLLRSPSNRCLLQRRMAAPPKPKKPVPTAKKAKK